MPVTRATSKGPFLDTAGHATAVEGSGPDGADAIPVAIHPAHAIPVTPMTPDLGTAGPAAAFPAVITKETTGFGVFLTHDLIAIARTPSAGSTADARWRNARSGALRLASVYGPETPAQTTGAPPPTSLRARENPTFLDLGPPPAGFIRRDTSVVIGDGRNLFDPVAARIHHATARLHNRAADFFLNRLSTMDPDILFDEAQNLTRWHIQWLVINSFVPTLCGATARNTACDGNAGIYRRFAARQGDGVLPVPLELVEGFVWGREQTGLTPDLLAEALCGLIIHDPSSYWHQKGLRGRWHPSDGITVDGESIDRIDVLLRV